MRQGLSQGFGMCSEEDLRVFKNMSGLLEED
jgi:hypothetical protein